MKPLDRLQLQNDLAGYQEVEPMHIQVLSSIADWKPFFTFEWNAVRRELVSNCAAVRLLDQSRSELAMDCNAASDGLVYELFDCWIERCGYSQHCCFLFRVFVFSWQIEGPTGERASTD